MLVHSFSVSVKAGRGYCSVWIIVVSIARMTSSAVRCPLCTSSLHRFAFLSRDFFAASLLPSGARKTPSVSLASDGCLTPSKSTYYIDIPYTGWAENRLMKHMMITGSRALLFAVAQAHGWVMLWPSARAQAVQEATSRSGRSA